LSEAGQPGTATHVGPSGAPSWGAPPPFDADVFPPRQPTPSAQRGFVFPQRDFERTIDALLRGEITPEERQLLPPLVRTSVMPGMTRGEALASATVAAAFALEEKHLANVLKRVWPEVVKHEVTPASNAPPAFSPLENLNDEDRATMLRLAQKAIRGSSK